MSGNKKEQYFNVAQRMYVEQHTPLSGIAKRIDVSERTLVEWKKEGDWENKRSQFLKSMYSCYSELYEAVRKMTIKLNADLDSGIIPDKSTMDFLRSMIDKIPKLKEFERAQIVEIQSNDTRQEKKDEDLSTKVAQLIDKKLMEA